MFRCTGSDSDRPWLLPVLLVATSAISSLALACVTPFAAFSVTAAYALSARTALLTVTAVWLANQVIGFAILGYPWTVDTALWGLAIGTAALIAAAVACVTTRLMNRNIVITLSTTLVMAFGVFEASLFLVSFGLGGRETFTPAIVGHLALLNFGWTVALAGASEVLRPAGSSVPNMAAGARIAP